MAIKFFLAELFKKNLLGGANLPPPPNQNRVNPETMRQRLGTHQYKDSDNVRGMRRLDNLYVLDFQECRLKNIEDYRRALILLFLLK